MWRNVSSWTRPLRGLLALTLSGQAVKWLDDLVDAPPDERDAPAAADCGAGGGLDGGLLLPPLGKAVYSAAALCLAGRLDARITGAVFWSAFALGMFKRPLRAESFPGGPPEWGETAVALGIAAATAGPRLAGGIGAGLAAAQALDDLRDREIREPLRRLAGQRGSLWARRFLGAAAVAAAGTALQLTPYWAVAVLAGSRLLSPPRLEKEAR